jgi:putative inorganic carbon (hco3(-)) transporter
LLGSIAVILSFSRGGWLAYSITLVLLSVSLICKRIIKFKTAAISTILIVIMIALFWNYIEVRIVSDDHNAAGSRVTLMQIALNMIQANPLSGVGINNYYNVIHLYTNTPNLQNIYLNVVHNHYLYVLAETGIIGFIAFLWLLLQCFHAALQCERIKNNIFFSSIGSGTKYALIAMAIHMLVEPYGSYQFLANFLYFPVVCMACLRIHESEKLTSTINVISNKKLYASQRPF